MGIYIIVFEIGLILGLFLGIWTLRSGLRDSGYRIRDGIGTRYIVEKIEDEPPQANNVKEA